MGTDIDQQVLFMDQDLKQRDKLPMVTSKDCLVTMRQPAKTSTEITHMFYLSVTQPSDADFTFLMNLYRVPRVAL